jgi:hypothetical protein
VHERERKKPDGRDLVLHARAPIDPPIDPAITAPAAAERIAARYQTQTGLTPKVVLAGDTACSPS